MKYLMSITGSEWANRVDVGIDLESLQLDDPKDQRKLAEAVMDALGEIEKKDESSNKTTPGATECPFHSVTARTQISVGESLEK